MKLLSAHNNKRFFNKYGFKLAMLLASLFVLCMILIISLKAREQYLVKQKNYQPQQIEKNNLSKRETYRVSDITSSNLFGRPERAVATTSEKAPKTIIMAGKKQSELYSVGDTIKGGSVEIQEIRNDEVIINRNGVLESLPLIKKTDRGNNQIFVFSSPEEQGDELNPDIYPPEELYPELNNSSSNPTPTAIENPQARKIRKPNFSGLDRKLKEMGEL